MFGMGAFRRKARQFEYRPRFYDPEKEERELRRRELLGEKAYEEIPAEDYKPGQYIRQNMMSRRTVSSTRLNRGSRTVRYAVVILALLFALVWVLW